MIAFVLKVLCKILPSGSMSHRRAAPCLAGTAQHHLLSAKKQTIHLASVMSQMSKY